MYALKARDKLHKLEKEAYEERHSPRGSRASEASPARGRRQKNREERSTTAQREAKYVGTFLMDGGRKSDFVKAVKHQLSRLNLKDPSHALMPVSLLINMEGIKVLSPETHELVMAHSLKRILYCTSESKKHLFVIVSRDSEQEESEQVYTHIFVTAKKDQANELNQIVSKAFKVHFARATIARERKKAVRKSMSHMQDSQQHQSPRTDRGRSASPQPSRARSTSPHPPVNAVPPYNPNVPARSRGGVGGGASDSSLQYRPQQFGVRRSPSPNRLSTAIGGGVTGGNRRSRADLTREVGMLELEVTTIQSRLAEIGEQKLELAGFDDAISQLVTQESALHQQLEVKRRQLGTVQFQLQDAAVQDLSHLHIQPPGAYAMPTQGPAYSPSRQRHDAPLPDFSLEDAVWFHEGIPRDIAMEILCHQPEGAFMVRQSSSNPGSFALSMKGPSNKILHYLIEALPSGFRLQTSSLMFGSVVELIHSYTAITDILPCTLNLSATNPMGMNGGYNGEDDSDEDFSHFSNSAEYRLLS